MSTDVDTADGDGPALDERSAGRRILGNFVALVAARPLTWLSTIGLTILLPRYLGDVNLGRINLAFAFADWCGLLASMGIAVWLAKEIAQRRAFAPRTVLNAITLSMTLAVTVAVLGAVVATLIGFEPLTRSLVYLLSAHMLLTVFMGVLIGALQGIQELRVVAAADAVTKMLHLGLIAAVLLNGYGPVAVAVAYVAGDLVAVLWLLVAVRRKVGLQGPVRLREWRRILVGGIPFLVWQTALLTYARIDVVILALFAQDAVLGWYAAAYRIVSIPLFIPTVLLMVLFPALSAAAAGDDHLAFNRLARRAILVVSLTTVPMAFGLIALTGNLIELFGYPDEFTNSIWPTMILATSLPLVGIDMMLGAILSAKDKQRHWAIVGVVAAVLNVALNFVAIPYTQERFDNGAIGAAFVTSLTEVILIVAGVVLLPKGTLDRATYVAVGKCVGLGTLMGLVVGLTNDLPMLVTVPLGIVIYGAGVALLRVVSREDVESFRSLISRRPAEMAPAEV